MNLSITNVCNRRCEYCFQKEWFLANSKEEVREMNLDSVEAIMKWFDDDHFKILGGEPLLYSDLDGLFNLFNKYNKRVSVISNISIPTDKFKYIVDTYAHQPIEGFLINTDYPEYQEELFLTNIKYLIEHTTKLFGITLSTTLLPDKEKIRQSSNRLKKILTSCRFGSRYVKIRVSPSEPNHIDTFNTYNFTLDAYDIWLRLNRLIPNLSVSFDCPVNACELDYELYGKRGANISFNGNKCFNDMPFDIMPDRSAIWCSSSNFLKINDVLEYKNIKECRRELRRQYKEYWKNNKLLCDYETCGKYGMCQGLCPAKNESLKQLLNSKS